MQTLNSTFLWKSIPKTWGRSPGCWLQLEFLQTEWSSLLLHPFMNRTGRKRAPKKVIATFSLPLTSLWFSCVPSKKWFFFLSFFDYNLHVQGARSIVSTLWQDSTLRLVCRRQVIVAPMSSTCGHSCRKMHRSVSKGCFRDITVAYLDKKTSAI